MSDIHDYEWLEEQYVVEGRSYEEIAEEAGETVFTVNKHIRRASFDNYDECPECGEYFENLGAHASAHEEDEDEEEYEPDE